MQSCKISWQIIQINDSSNASDPPVASSAFVPSVLSSETSCFGFSLVSLESPSSEAMNHTSYYQTLTLNSSSLFTNWTKYMTTFGFFIHFICFLLFECRFRFCLLFLFRLKSLQKFSTRHRVEQSLKLLTLIKSAQHWTSFWQLKKIAVPELAFSLLPVIFYSFRHLKWQSYGLFTVCLSPGHRNRDGKKWVVWDYTECFTLHRDQDPLFPIVLIPVPVLGPVLE